MPGFDDFMQQLYNRPLFFMKLIANKAISILRWFLHIEASPQNSRLSKYPKKVSKKKKKKIMWPKFEKKTLSHANFSIVNKNVFKVGEHENIYIAGIKFVKKKFHSKMTAITIVTPPMLFTWNRCSQIITTDISITKREGTKYLCVVTGKAKQVDPPCALK